ncbi:MAG TPA: pilus assembly protein TadG-related protein [Acidimicrobiales bacterium]
MRGNERGQTIPLVLVVLALAMTFALTILHQSRTVAGRAAASHAADAAALAGAVDGQGAAEAVARANGAELLSFVQDGDVVVVEIRRGSHHATARAELVVELTHGDR